MSESLLHVDEYVYLTNDALSYINWKAKDVIINCNFQDATLNVLNREDNGRWWWLSLIDYVISHTVTPELTHPDMSSAGSDNSITNYNI